MKKTILSLAVLIALASCGEQNTNTQQQAGLDQLKKERDALNEKITQLEEEMAKTDSTRDEKLKTVEILPLKLKRFDHYIDVQGKVDADENVSLNAEMPGTVSKIFVHEGDAVKNGEVLAELDLKVIQQGIAQLKTQLDLATTMYEKQKNLWDQKVGTEIQFLTAKNQKETLEKNMSTLQQQLKMSKIISPINGVVDAVDIKIGQATMPGMPAIRVVNMSNLKVKGEVSESYASKIKNGNEVVVIFPDVMDTLKTKIAYAAKVISPLNRTFTVTMNLNSKKEYHPNMVAIIKIVSYSNPKAIVVPMNTIQRAKEGDFIFIADGNRAKKAKVKIGKTYNGMSEIIEGLKEGDKLIAKGFQELNEGEKVKF